MYNMMYIMYYYNMIYCILCGTIICIIYCIILSTIICIYYMYVWYCADL
jgi:hypothetical protein